MKRFIGDKAFYKMVLMVVVPIIIQNGITNLVGMLDNIMVGRLGTEQMSGVAIVNQLMFVYNVCIFGAISGAGIFGAQFYGNGDHEGVRNTFRFKLIVCAAFLAIGIVAFTFFGEPLIQLYLNEEGNVENVQLALEYGSKYLIWMIIGLVPFTINQSYTSTLRETGQTVLPMVSGVVAVLVNLALNYILIFGNFGAPKLGVEGAAIATVISRIVECGITVVWTHANKVKNQFIVAAYKTLRVPAHIAKQILRKGTPLILNEALWATGQAAIMQCYSVRGLDAIAGLNISSTISNVFNIVFLAMGNAIAIIIGQLLGAGKMKEAKETDTKLIFAAVSSCLVVGVCMFVIAPLFPNLYNTSGEVRNLASNFIRISAICMPLHAFTNASYFTLRSGGKTGITFLFDSGYVWCISLPLAFILSRYTGLPMVSLYLVCQLAEVIKCVIGFVLVKKGLWLHRLSTE